MVVQAVKRKKFLWLATKAAEWIALNLHVDPETKTWKISSKPMWTPAFQTRNYEDIAAIFKSKPETFVTTEEKTPEGKFKKFTVETAKNAGS